MPDNRADINSTDKVTQLLTTAYASHNSIVMAEMASDNAMDNGSLFTYDDRMQEESYLWQPITTEGNDSPKPFWDACYGAVATANQALAAIDNMGNPSELQGQRGEALLCRSWAMFQLANIFCLAYNPETANTDLGLPFPLAPETELNPKYVRGTMAELYSKIEKDLEEGLPLIDDNIYSVPKYHFNRAAAYAFAARFYLYYQKWDKVIECANQALGSAPDQLMRNWAYIAGEMASNFEARCNQYVNASEGTNLLIETAYSSMVYWIGPYNLGRRYGHNNTNIAQTETYRTTGVRSGIWGAHATSTGLWMGHSCWGYSEKLSISKYYGYFEYTDKVNGIGYRRNAIVRLCGDEVVLCRAEAYAMKGDYANALADINFWLKYNGMAGVQVTQEQVVKQYGNMPYMEDENQKPIVADKGTGSPKKRLHPLGFTLKDETQENFIHCILHMRRCQTIQEGLRWMDIKRWGIEIAHNREGQAPDLLLVNDPRRAFQLPQDVIDAGLEANPRNEQN
jgi:tetratricopeptide (TPR) repeat protein